MWDVVDKLGPWPILQFGLIALIIFIAVVTYMKVLAAKFPAQQPQNAQEVSFLYFQGWFKTVLDDLNILKNNQELNKLQMRETFAEKLRESRHDVKGALAEVQAELKLDIQETAQGHAAQLKNISATLNEIRDRLLRHR